MEKILDGNKVSNLIKEDIKKDVIKLKEKGIIPYLVTILVGEHPPSGFYVNKKKKTCEELGMNSEIYELSKETNEGKLINLIHELNKNKDVHGILVQLPLPDNINQYEVMDTIISFKDVDGFNSDNIAELYRGEDCLEPCTPKGILTLLDYYKISTEGKNVTIIGRSDIVGKPLAMMMSSRKRNATVTICHSKTEDLEQITRQADILVGAIGKAHYIKEDMVKEGAVVIDVGINKIDDPTSKKGKRLVGDVDFENILNKVSYITPVPGGVGPMTVISLMQNTIKAANYRI